MQKNFIAIRAAKTINQLHEIKINNQNNKELICDIKKIAIRQKSDWESCKENNYCKDEVSSEYYSNVDENLSDIIKYECGN